MNKKEFFDLSYRENFKKIIFFGTAFIYIFIYAKRFVYPDIAFDTLNYHFSLGSKLYNSDNIFRPFSDGEFFPLGFRSFNPFVDFLNYEIYGLLGYRLGNILSLVSILVILYVFYKCLNKFEIELNGLLSLLLFSTCIVNESMFQLATYYTDNIYSIFTVLSFICLIKIYEKMDNLNWRVSFLTYFLLGFFLALLATKLTNVFIILPMFIGALYCIYNAKYKIKYKIIIFFILIFSGLVLVIPNLASVYYLTGNPVFPYYNAIFKSTYYPLSSWGFNFGPHSFWERISYPFTVIIYPTRLGEVKDLFPDLKLIYLFFLFILINLLSFRYYDGKRKFQFYIILACFIMWQILFGYSRYAIGLEYLLGLSCVIGLSLYLKFRSNNKKIIIIIIMIVVFWMFYQSISIIKFNYRYDMSWRPKSSIIDAYIRAKEVNIFEKFTKVDDNISKKLSAIDFVMLCANPSSGFIPTLKEIRDKPVLNFDNGVNGPMTSNRYFINKRNLELTDYLKHKPNNKIYRFALVYDSTKKGWKSNQRCNLAIDKARKIGQKISIDSDFILIDNFVGDKHYNIVLKFGYYNF